MVDEDGVAMFKRLVRQGVPAGNLEFLPRPEGGVMGVLTAGKNGFEPESEEYMNALAVATAYILAEWKGMSREDFMEFMGRAFDGGAGMAERMKGAPSGALLN